MKKIPLLRSGMCCRRVNWRSSFLLQCCVVLVPQLCPSLWNPVNCSLPGSSVHGILQARILKWVVIPFSRRSSQPRDRTRVSCITGGFFTVWATREAFSCRRTIHLGPRAKSVPPHPYFPPLPVFVSKVISHRSHAHSFTNLLWLFSCQNHKTESLWQKMYGPWSLKYLHFGPSHEKKKRLSTSAASNTFCSSIANIHKSEAEWWKLNFLALESVEVHKAQWLKLRLKWIWSLEIRGTLFRLHLACYCVVLNQIVG